MQNDSRPHSRKKQVGSGSADVRKGQQFNGRPVGQQHPAQNASRPGLANPQSMQNRAAGRGPSRAAGAGGLLSVFFALPKKVRSILLIVLLAVILFAVVRYMAGGGISLDNFNSNNNYDSLSDPASDSNVPPSPGNSDASGVDLSVSSLARAKRVTPLGGGKDTVTVMVYMCGTDLESKYGMATKDLSEMARASIADHVNLLVLTGGCKQWKNDIVSSSVNEIYQVKNGGLTRLVSDFGTASMTDPENLTNFIDYCETNYPANRNFLILWDHGGGTLSGYGYDEKRSGSSMTLDKLNGALANANCVFDWIGFDACLMSTLETALVCNHYADYMIASEEVEPGTGWDYTGWLNQISSDPATPTPVLAKTLIDDFVTASCSASSQAQVTLSVVDLAELQGTIPDSFRSFATSTAALLKSEDYQRISDARSGVRQFAQSSKINQVDLADLALRIGSDEGNALAEAIKSCVKYNSATMSRCYGLSIFFPYESLSSMNSAVATYNTLGMDSEYTKCIQSFASLEYGGQISSSASQNTAYSTDLLGSLLDGFSSTGNSPLGALLGSFIGNSGAAASGNSLDASSIIELLSAFSGRSMKPDYNWVDTDLIANSAEQIAGTFLDPSHISITERDGHKLLHLTEEEWSQIQTVELGVFVDDGSGFIDLGLDNTFDWYGDDLLLDYDGTWLCVNGHAAAYYLVSDTENADGSWTTVGRIPALLNGDAVNLRVVFDETHPNGAITGSYPLYDDALTETQAKGDLPIAEGDRIQLLCDYYRYDGSFEDSYLLGDAFVVDSKGLSVENLHLAVSDVQVCYRLTDLYANHYYTPAWTLTQ